jgi:hypothetical protein
MVVWAHATVKLWNYNGDMGASYAENMVLEWMDERKLQRTYGTRMEVWA